EALARKIGRGAETLELVHDGAAAFGLPFPDALDELFAAERATIDLLGGKLALDDHLGGDAGMVGARLPEHVLLQHAVEADQNVLNRIVERMPDMERTGDVGRRDDDGERLRTGPGPCPGRKRI